MADEISVDPQALRAWATVLKMDADKLHKLSASITEVVDALQLDASVRASIDNLKNRFTEKAGAAIYQMRDLADFLDRKKDEFSHIDCVEAYGIYTGIKYLGLLGGGALGGSEVLLRILKYISTSLSKPQLESFSYFEGFEDPAMFLDDGARLTGSASKTGLSTLAKIGIALGVFVEGVDLGYSSYNDWQRYEGDTSMQVSAITVNIVEAAIAIGVIIALAALVPATAPLWVAALAFVGGVAVTLALSELGDWLVEIGAEDWVVETLDEWVVEPAGELLSDAGEWIADSVTSGASAVADSVADGAEWVVDNVGDAIESAGSAIRDFCNDLW